MNKYYNLLIIIAIYEYIYKIYIERIKKVLIQNNFNNNFLGDQSSMTWLIPSILISVANELVQRKSNWGSNSEHLLPFVSLFD